MMKKKGIAPGVLVGIIVMVVVFVILLRLDMIIVNILTGGAEDQICFLSASLSSFTKAGPKTVTDLQCPRRLVNVMMNSNDVPAQTRIQGTDYVYINKPIARNQRNNLAEWYNESESNFDIKESKDRVLKYRLNEIMAKELKKCWGNLGRGTYNLFEQDLPPVNYGGNIKDGDSILSYFKLWNLGLRKAPKICHICSTIIFHDNVKSKFREEIDLTPFLTNNPVNLATREAPSYYEFLKDDIEQSDLFGVEYRYTTGQTMAVVFMRMNILSYAEEIFRDLASLSSEQIFSDRDYKEGRILAVDFPLLIPFEEVSNNCDRFA